jgi:hypothetical protein
MNKTCAACLLALTVLRWRAVRWASIESTSAAGSLLSLWTELRTTATGLVEPGARRPGYFLRCFRRVQLDDREPQQSDQQPNLDTEASG